MQDRDGLTIVINVDADLVPLLATMCAGRVELRLTSSTIAVGGNDGVIGDLCKSSRSAALRKARPDPSCTAGGVELLRPDPDFLSAKREAQVRLLDAAKIGNGVKAIGIWLHRNWSDELTALWGRPSNPHSIRRWRTARRRRTEEELRA